MLHLSCATLQLRMLDHLETKGRPSAAAEMWFLRRVMSISWTEHNSNEGVLRRAGTERILLNSIRKRQMEFSGHVM